MAGPSPASELGKQHGSTLSTSRPVGKSGVRRAQRSRDRYQRELALQGKRIRALQARLSLAGAPRLIPRAVLVMTRTIVADATGGAGKMYTRRMSNRVYAGAVMTAAFVPFDGLSAKRMLLGGAAGGAFRYSWADTRARCIVALGCALHALSAPSRRQGRWNRSVRGVTRGALCALLANPFEPERRPSISALVGTHRVDGTLESGQVGYLRALELAGALYAQQLPSSKVADFERLWPSGYASNRYWLLTDRPDAPHRPAQRSALHAFQALADELLGGAVRSLRALPRRLRRLLTGPPAAPP